MRVHRAAAVALCLVAAPALAGQGSLTTIEAGTTLPLTPPLPYLEWEPADAGLPAHVRPLVLFLHGIGEEGNGSDVFAAETRNGPCALLNRAGTWPTYFTNQDALVLCPQSAGWWSADVVATFLTYALATYDVDPLRIYITGLSMGGGGTWDYIAANPGIAAAALPISGASSGFGGKAPDAFTLLPTWALQNWGDPTVPIADSIGWVNAIAKTSNAEATTVLDGYPNDGGTTAAADTETARFDGTGWTWTAGTDSAGADLLRLTIYPLNQHDAWTATYANTSVWDWLFAQALPGAGSTTTGGTSSAGATSSGGTTGSTAGSTSGGRSTSTGGGGSSTGGGSSSSGTAAASSGTGPGAPPSLDRESGGCSNAGALCPLALTVSLLLSRRRRLLERDSSTAREGSGDCP